MLSFQTSKVGYKCRHRKLRFESGDGRELTRERVLDARHDSVQFPREIWHR